MDAVVSSPPYAESLAKDAGGRHDEVYKNWWGGGDIRPRCYSGSEGNLGNMSGEISSDGRNDNGGGALRMRDWYGLYGEGWGQEIVREAYSHPAKYARGLIRRIYDYLVEEGWLRPGMTVLDPFGGVALGALDCMRVGCDWVGVELEEKFVGLGEENLARWERRYAGVWDWWGEGRLVQGDSREIGKVVREKAGAWVRLGAPDVVVSSPPYLNRQVHEHGIDWDKIEGNGGGRYSQAAVMANYGEGTGQFGRKAGEEFWGAAREVVAGCGELLAPGAVAVWVVKRFVRDGEIVQFPDQWRRMCEGAGFGMVEWIRAWVVEEYGVQVDLWGNGHDQRTERKSFFRRLYEKKRPDNAIDWEDVLVMVRR